MTVAAVSAAPTPPTANGPAAAQGDASLAHVRRHRQAAADDPSTPLVLGDGAVSGRFAALGPRHLYAPRQPLLALGAIQTFRQPPTTREDAVLVMEHVDNELARLASSAHFGDGSSKL